MTDQQPDIAALLQQAQAMQTQLNHAREEMSSKIVEGRSAGGKVSVSANCDFEFQAVHLDPSVLDDAAMLEDLLLAALRDMSKQISDLNAEAVTGIFGAGDSGEDEDEAE